VAQIRDVIAFPKTQRGQDLLVDTPTLRHGAAAARPAHPGAPVRFGQGGLTPACSKLPRMRTMRSLLLAAVIVVAAPAFALALSEIGVRDCRKKRARS
jgi:hypothetical protein